MSKLRCGMCTLRSLHRARLNPIVHYLCRVLCFCRHCARLRAPARVSRVFLEQKLESVMVRWVFPAVLSPR